MSKSVYKVSSWRGAHSLMYKSQLENKAKLSTKRYVNLFRSVPNFNFPYLNMILSTIII